MVTATHDEEVAPATGATRPRWSRSEWLTGGLALAALIALHAGVQLLSRPTPRWGDAILTFGYARDFPDVDADHHSTRLGIILPARLFQELFGFGQVAYYSYPALMGVLLVVATFSVGRRLFGLVAGTVAGFLVVFHPILVRTVGNTTSWHLLPDVPAAAWFTSGLALLLAVAHGRTGTPVEPSRAATARFLGAGLCFGLAYTCREFVAFMFVLIPLVAVLYRVPWRRLLMVLAPMAAVLVAELVISAIVWGDPIARFRIAGGHGSPTDPIPRLDTLMKFPDALFNQPRGSVSILLLVLTLAGALVLWRRGLLITAAWLLSLFVPLLLLGGFADPTYISLRLHLTRYWVPILPAMAVGSVGTVREICLRAAAHPSSRNRWLGWRSVAVGLVFLAWYPVPMLRYAVGNPNDGAWNEFRAYLQENDPALDRISTDYRSGQELLVYSHAPLGGDRVWHGEINVIRGLDELGLYDKLEQVPGPDALPDGALLYTGNTAVQEPQSADGWLLAFRAKGIRLYVPADSALESLVRPVR